MANTYENLAVDNVHDTDAEFQAWGRIVEDAILASGFLESAPDTGQVNLATMVRPSAGAYAGYRIYRGKDSLQATRPYYVKVEYGTSPSGLAKFQLKFTSSTGSNGAGTPTGVVATAQSFTVGSVGSGNSQVFGGGGSSAAFLYLNDPGNANLDMFWMAGRLRDQADGSASPEVLFQTLQSAAGMIIGQTYLWTDGSIAWTNQISPGIGTHMLDQAAAIHTGGNASIVRVFQLMIYRNAKTLVWPMVSGRPAELPFPSDANSAKFSLAIWGGNHTFLPINESSTGGNRLCMLWE